MATSLESASEPRAKEYSSLKYLLAALEFVYLVILLFLFQASGLSAGILDALGGGKTHPAAALPAYLFLLLLIYQLSNFPFNYYASFVLEHRFSLSRQKFLPWLSDWLKSFIVSYLIMLICMEAFYFMAAYSPGYWWLEASLSWIALSLVLAKAAPVVIIPLFFKYKSIQDASLKERVMKLASSMGVSIMDVYEIDFSKKTLKANAAFVGMGRTKRVLLADTLKDKYSYDEIEVILAHEFAHYKKRHLLKLVLINSGLTLFIFYFMHLTNRGVFSFFRLGSLSDPAGMPLVFAYLALFGAMTQPLMNFISRRFERQADKAAIRQAASSGAFISLMDKLASQNLSDRDPHPLIKFFFFDHPPIGERIAAAGAF